jgi:hypothetical protein
MSPGPTSSAAAAAAAFAAAFTAQSWLGQIPAAPPGQLPHSTIWDLHGKDVKTEQQILVSIARAHYYNICSNTCSFFFSLEIRIHYISKCRYISGTFSLHQN